MPVLSGGERAVTTIGPSDQPAGRATEAQSLRAEWERLREEHHALWQATNAYQLAPKNDPDALRSHLQRIRNHQARLSAWSELLEGFHARYGALGLECPWGPPPVTCRTSRGES
jgi:hypothetical protein